MIQTLFLKKKKKISLLITTDIEISRGEVISINILNYHRFCLSILWYEFKSKPYKYKCILSFIKTYIK